MAEARMKWLYGQPLDGGVGAARLRRVAVIAQPAHGSEHPDVVDNNDYCPRAIEKTKTCRKQLLHGSGFKVKDLIQS